MKLHFGKQTAVPYMYVSAQCTQSSNALINIYSSKTVAAYTGSAIRSDVDIGEIYDIYGLSTNYYAISVTSQITKKSLINT